MFFLLRWMQMKQKNIRNKLNQCLLKRKKNCHELLKINLVIGSLAFSLGPRNRLQNNKWIYFSSFFYKHFEVLIEVFLGGIPALKKIWYMFDYNSQATDEMTTFMRKRNISLVLCFFLLLLFLLNISEMCGAGWLVVQIFYIHDFSTTLWAGI